MAKRWEQESTLYEIVRNTSSKLVLLKFSRGKNFMICDEIIKNVYLGKPKYHEKGNCFFDYYYDMALHMTPNYRILLECGTCYISLQTDGAHTIKKTGDVSSIEKEGEWIESFYRTEDDPEDTPWVDYEFTLFTGEKIVEINPCEEGYLVRFTDFQLRVVPYSINEEVFRFWPGEYSHVLGTERLIKKCPCGGTGRLVIDNVFDYGIRCDKCQIGTGASVCAVEAIEEWNDGENLYQIGDYPIEAFYKYCFGEIEYIAIREHYNFYDDNLLDCKSVIIKIDNKLFEIESRYSGQGKYDFAFSELTDFNPKVWPRRIIATDKEAMRFVCKETKPDMHSALRFEIGKRPILITADETGLNVGLSHWDQNGEWLEFENNCLLNDELANQSC